MLPVEPMLESRRATRRAVDVACDLITARWDRPVRSRCTDLSPYGMWLETTLPLVEWERLVVSFRLGAVALSLFGVVRRVVRGGQHLRTGLSGVGIEFEGTSPWEQGLLAASLQGLPPPLPEQRAAWTPAPAVAH
jgi:hypothetical protein